MTNKNTTNINSHIEHTLLSLNSTSEQVIKYTNEVKAHNFSGFCTSSGFICDPNLKDYFKSINLISTIGFPHGYSCTKAKITEVMEVKKHGANEIDMVINLSWVFDKQWRKIQDEVNLLKKESNLILKVIIETPLLSDDQILKTSSVLLDTECDYIKTCTGFNGSVLKKHITLIKSIVKNQKKIKASGGIKTIEFAKELINLGADKIGTSRGTELI